MQDGGGGGGEETAVRKGPWTMEEDLILANYVAANGEGDWNSLARAAGTSVNWLISSSCNPAMHGAMAVRERNSTCIARLIDGWVQV
jgi:hypothetical protein